MRNLVIIALLFSALTSAGQPFSKTEINRWQDQAQRVTIIRDNWGVPMCMEKPMPMLCLDFCMHNAKMIFPVLS
jgi:hypothetical protein